MKKKVKGFWNDFKAFINRGNVVDMAIGVVVATAFKDIVTKFTSAFISPLVALITGGVRLDDLVLVIRPEVLNADGTVATPEVSLAWGAFVQAILDFLIIAFVLFLVIRFFTHATSLAKNLAVTKEDKEAAELAAKEAAEKEQAEKEAAEAARIKAEQELADAKAKEEETLALLREIRDALKNK